MIGLRRGLEWLLRRVGLGRATVPRRAIKPRAVAVVVDGEQVLVIKRHSVGGITRCCPAVGRGGETAAEAALRELHEETTLVAEIDRLLWIGT